MGCETRGARRALPILGVAAAVVGLSAQAALAAVSLHMSPATVTVQQRGDVGQICVTLSTGGEQVAGTQNDLVWDGSCATLASTSSCQEVGSHGKQLQGGFPPQFDFTFRALILSLSDVEPMPDGPLYCCSFQSENEQGECCSISIVRPGASDPKGNALGVAGAGRGQICTASDGGSRGGSVGSSGQQRPPSASNVGDVPVGEGAAPAPAAPAAGAGGAPPAAAVLPGGGVRVPDVPAEAPTAGEPVPEIPTPVPAQALPPGGLTPRQPAIAPPSQATPPTAAASVAPTSPAAADTATPAPTVPPTVAAKAPSPAAQAAQAQKSEDGGGWFGCHIAPTAPTPVAAVAAPFAIAVLALRWRRRRTRRSESKH